MKILQNRNKSLRNRTVLFTTLGMALAFTAGLAVHTLMQPIDNVQAEQVGSSPESGVDSRIKQAFDSLVSQGHGSSSVPEWTNDWGTMWNRIMAAASWTPGGDATADDVLAGKTYYANDRTAKTGTLDVENFSAIGLYQGFDQLTHQTEIIAQGSWSELMAAGGTPAEVSVNGSTLALASTLVMQDDRTGLIWTDSSATAASHNNFTWVAGDDRANPAGNSCNFNATGDANEWCNVSNFSAPDYNNPANNTTPDQAKTGVSANEFCLNLAADDGSGVKTDWRVPTYPEMMIAWLNGSQSYLSYATRHYWSSSEVVNGKTLAWRVALRGGLTYYNTKTHTDYYVRCVRG